MCIQASVDKANLVNEGILPLEFENPEDGDAVSQGDMLTLRGIHEGLDSGVIVMTEDTGGKSYRLKCDISPRQAAVIRAGGLLNHTKANNAG